MGQNIAGCHIILGGAHYKSGRYMGNTLPVLPAVLLEYVLLRGGYMREGEGNRRTMSGCSEIWVVE